MLNSDIYVFFPVSGTINQKLISKTSVNNDDNSSLLINEVNNSTKYACRKDICDSITRKNIGKFDKNKKVICL